MRLITKTTLGLAALAATAAATLPARATEICGWYAIATCTSDYSAADEWVKNNGWGEVIDTSEFGGFRPGLFCAVSGPHKKAKAFRVRQTLLDDGYSDSAYIKRACYSTE
jgi:hypothetical protein